MDRSGLGARMSLDEGREDEVEDDEELMMEETRKGTNKKRNQQKNPDTIPEPIKPKPHALSFGLQI